MTGKTRKATFNLHTEVIEALDEAVQRGESRSKNALVERALIKELNELKRKIRGSNGSMRHKTPCFAQICRKSNPVSRPRMKKPPGVSGNAAPTVGGGRGAP